MAKFSRMTTALAVVAPAYGGPDQLDVREVEVPPPDPARSRSRSARAGVNPVDFKLFSGARGADPDALPRRSASRWRECSARSGPRHRSPRRR